MSARQTVRNRYPSRAVPFCTALLLLAVSSLTATAAPGDAAGSIDGTKSASQETPLGDITADAIRASAGTQFAFLPANALRPVLVAGPAQTAADLKSALRDSGGGLIVVLKLTGAQIRSALERSVSHEKDDYAGFLQISGMKMTYNPNEPGGDRVTSLTKSDGSEIAPAERYTVASTSTLGEGGLGYFEVWTQSDIARTLSVTMADSLTSFVPSHQPLQSAVDGRIVSR